jgi:hypothetical protein
MSLSTLRRVSRGVCWGWQRRRNGHVQALEQRPGVEGRDSLRRVSGSKGAASVDPRAQQGNGDIQPCLRRSSRSLKVSTSRGAGVVRPSQAQAHWIR